MTWIFPALLKYQCQIQVHLLTCCLMAWNTVSGLGVSMASHILTHTWLVPGALAS